MKRGSWVLISAAVASIVVAALLVMRSTASRAVPDLTGRWKSWRSELLISRKADVFTITVSNPSGLLGGEYSGRFHNGAIHVTGPLAPLCGSIDYVRDTRKLEFCGEEFERIGG
jgi:hypothetical protein